MARPSSTVIRQLATASTKRLNHNLGSTTQQDSVAKQPRETENKSQKATSQPGMFVGVIKHGVRIRKLRSGTKLLPGEQLPCKPSTTNGPPPSSPSRYRGSLSVCVDSIASPQSTEHEAIISTGSRSVGAALESTAPELLWGLEELERMEEEAKEVTKLVKTKIISTGGHISSHCRYFAVYRNVRVGSKKMHLLNQKMKRVPSGAKSFSTSALYSRPSVTLEASTAESTMHPSILRDPSINHPKHNMSSIRDRLRIWEVENADAKNSRIISGEIIKTLQAGDVSNSLTRPMDVDSFDGFGAEDLLHDRQPLFERGEILDFGDQRSFFLCGDLVELRASSSGLRTELGIFIREFENQSQFYTMSGKWINCKTSAVKFFVPNFVEAYEVDDLLPFLPDKDVEESMQDKLQGFENQLPRNIGAPLVKKMLEFWNASDTAYRAAAFKLDNAHRLVARESTLRYASLLELAKELVPASLKNKEGEFPASVLFAVHRSLMQDDIGFRSQRLGNHRVWGSLEITSLVEAHIIKTMSDNVRKYQEWIVAQSRGTIAGKPDGFLKFLATARKLIARSRMIRDVSPHGIISPSKVDARFAAINNSDHIRNSFDGSDNHYIRFIESWCGLCIIDSTSTVNGIASTILRATGMYEGFSLDQSTGWTFLQEIGAITPWENRVAYDARLPGIGRKLIEDPKLLGLDLRDDVLDGHRKNWHTLPVYCIDDVDAKEIDDGISIEETEIPGEIWLHIHVADPSSQIAPNSSLGQNAWKAVQTVYFPERVISMLPSKLVASRFSLAPDRPVLTFSAKMNQSGNILEHRVRAGTIHNVVYLTNEVLRQVLGVSSSAKEVCYRVGNHPKTFEKRRNTISAAEIRKNPTHMENLRSLYRVSDAFRIALSQRGSVDMEQQDSSVSVALTPATPIIQSQKNMSTSYCYYEDPSIELKAEVKDIESTITTSIVKEAMIIAGHVAAHWCHERGIPVIFRVSQLRPDRPDPMIMFRKTILPILSPTKKLPVAVVDQYVQELGRVLPSTTAAPHIPIGVDMYTKSTSPLRRYTDMVVHWQIEAALVEEAKTGRSLIGSTRDDYLPFSKADLDAMIPRLDSREKQLMDAQRSADRTWILQLLIRAWKFGDGKLPKTFEYTVCSVQLDGRVSGRIPSLGNFGAVCQQPKWPTDIQVGDILEVEFLELNSYTRRAYVTPLRIISQAILTPAEAESNFILANE